MTDKILKIKLEVDTGEAAKLVKVTDNLVASTKEQIAKSSQLLDAEKKVASARKEALSVIAETSKQVEKYNFLLQQGGTAAYLANTQALTGLNTYNKELLKSQEILRETLKLKNSIKAAESFTAGAIGKLYTPPTNAPDGNRDRNPLTGAFNQEYLTKQYELQSKAIDEVKSYEVRKHKEAQDLKEFQDKAYANSKKVLYASLFDEIEAREKAASVKANRLASSGYGFAGTSSTRTNSPTPDAGRTRNPLTGQLLQESKAQEQAAKTSKEYGNELDKLSEKHDSLLKRIVQAVSIYRVYNFALNGLINGIKAIPNVGIELESIQSALTAVVGSETSVSSVLKGINEEAQRTGISVSTLRENFRTFSASATLAGESVDTTWRIFTNLNTTITSLHLSADQAQHTFLAFSQILNKGKVQSEELVKQLGNLLPGAFATMAKALNISTQELSKRMKQGLITAHDSLDAFAQEYARQFNNSFIVAQQGLNSNIGRLQSSLTLLGETIYKQTREPMIETVKALTSFTNEVTKAINGTSDFQKELNLVGKIISGTEFLILSNLLGKVVTQILPMVAGFKNIATQATLAATAMKGLEKGMAFLATPTAIIAGILLIADRLKEIISPADDLIEKLKKSREEAEKLAETNRYGANLTGAAKLQFDVDNSEEVKAQFDKTKELVEYVVAQRQKLAENTIKIGDTLVSTNPFTFNTNDIEKTKDAIARGVAELHKQEELYVSIRAQKKLDLELDAQKAKEKQGGNNLENVANEAKIKEVNFNKELEFQEALTKKEEQRYKAKLNSLKLQEEELKLQLERNKISDNPIANSIIDDKISDVKNQTIALEQEHQQRLLSIAKKSEDIIVGSVKKTTISVQQAFEKIQDIESAGVKTRGGRAGAVSITGALGKSQVQPSTLNDFTGDVPANILALEKKARFNLNVLKKQVTLTPSEIETLRDYALANTKKIDEVGKKLFEKLANQFEGDFVKAAVAYNTGAGRVKIASELAKAAGREDFESFLPTTGKLALNKRGLAEAQGYAKKARAAIGGESFEPSILEQQTKQSESLDKLESLRQERIIKNREEEIRLAERIKTIKEEEAKIAIESLQSGGNTREAEIAQVKAEFAQRYAEAERLNSELLRRRLPILEREKINKIELDDLQRKYNLNEQRFNQQVQEYTNKSLVGKLKNYQVSQLLFDLQNKYIVEQEKILENELKLATTEEQRLLIKDKLGLLEQKRAESANFNANFTGESLAPNRTQFLNNEVNIEGSRQTEIDLLNKENEAKLLSFEDYSAKKNEIEDRYNQASMLNNAIYHESLFGMTAENLMGVTKLTQRLFGEQSTAARAMFAMQKTAASGQAIMQTYVAANKAYAEGGPYLGPALAAIAVAAGLANVATILSQPMPSTTGIAHGGMTNVPKESTYLLDKGERVLSPKQNVDITSKVDNINKNVSGGGKSSSPNIRIVNVMDENLVYNALESDQSEQIIMNIVRKNR